jgi:hypothetical protein
MLKAAEGGILELDFPLSAFRWPLHRGNYCKGGYFSVDSLCLLGYTENN